MSALTLVNDQCVIKKQSETDPRTSSRMADKARKLQGVAGLKDCVCGATEAGLKANQCAKMTKAIGKCIGRVHGQEMKDLVLQPMEEMPVELMLPVKGATDKENTVWSKPHDCCLKKNDLCWDQNAKQIIIILEQVPRQ